MKKTLGVSQVADALRADEYGGWSYYGAEALAEYLDQYENDTDTELELDVVAIRCDFSEYASALEAARDHGYDEVVNLEPHGSVDLEEVAELEEAQALEWLEERTTVIPFAHDNPFMQGRTSGVIIQAF